jgi:RNA polymerase sigma factor (sigma-70 family)
MVRKKALSRLRCERDHDELDDTLVDVRIDLEAEFEKKERSDQLERKISGLSAENQQILRLYIDGCSGAEIAAALGITQSAARSRLSRAKDRLSRQ